MLIIGNRRQRVEMVQRRAARCVCGKFRQGLNCTGPTEMISHLGWPSLEVLRKVARLTLLYEMANNLDLMSTRSLLIPAPRSTRAMPPHAYMPMFHTPKRLYQYNSFFSRTVTDWNDLPNWIAAASSLEACLDPADLFLTHFSFPFSTAYSLTFIYPNTLLLSVLAPLPRRWALISLLVSALSIPHFPILVLHISLLIALISSHNFSTIHHTSSIVSKLTFLHYHLNLNLTLTGVTETTTNISQ